MSPERARPAADKSLRVLTDVINRIAGQIDFPLGAAEELLRAVATYTTLQMSRATAAERERIAQLADQHQARYRACTSGDHSPTFNPGDCKAWAHRRRFAELIHRDAGSAPVGDA